MSDNRMSPSVKCALCFGGFWCMIALLALAAMAAEIFGVRSNMGSVRAVIRYSTTILSNGGTARTVTVNDVVRERATISRVDLVLGKFQISAQDLNGDGDYEDLTMANKRDAEFINLAAAQAHKKDNIVLEYRWNDEEQKMLQTFPAIK